MWLFSFSLDNLTKGKTRAVLCYRSAKGYYAELLAGHDGFMIDMRYDSETCVCFRSAVKFESCHRHDSEFLLDIKWIFKKKEEWINYLINEMHPPPANVKYFYL